MNQRKLFKIVDNIKSTITSDLCLEKLSGPIEIVLSGHS